MVHPVVDWLLFFTLVLFCWNISEAIPIEDFIPFGRSNGDARAPTNDDGSTAPIPVSSLFPFFNHQHDSLIVNTNGVISFLGTMSTYTPSPFPLDTNKRLIAPYWADSDTNNGGDVWYRESTDPALLGRVSNEITSAFPQYHSFKASWLFIATWDNVAFYGANSIGQQKRCTFQCLLITNGRHSFTIFLFNKIQWTTGTESGGDSSTGLGGTPAQVGFDAGDGVNFYAINASRTPDIIHVTNMSNIGVPGKFIFRVDSAEIKEGGCNVNGTLTITPRQATSFGGTLLIISGPCFDQASSVSMIFSDGQEVPCQLTSDISATCISPTVYRTGKERVQLRLVRDEDNPRISRDVSDVFFGTITFVNHILTKRYVERIPLFWTHNAEVQLQWDAAELRFPNGSDVSVDLYYPNQISVNNIILTKFSHVTTLNSTAFQKGFLSFMLDFQDKAGIIKLSTSNDQSRYYWSDLFTVKDDTAFSENVCSTWFKSDLSLQTIRKSDVNPCPCTVAVAQIDTTRFHSDPSCIQEGKLCADQPHAGLCFQQNMPSTDGFGNQCCYDANGGLMNPGNYQGSGYASRYHYNTDKSNAIPYLSNFVNDVVPYEHCCIYPYEFKGSASTPVSCSNFYKRRPPNSCDNYVPPRPARGSGDPHFVTFDGLAYTFNPVGEFLAIEIDNFTLQIRTEQYGTSKGSSLTAFVAKPNYTDDIVEVRTNTIREIDVLINGELAEFDTSISNTIFAEGSTVQKSFKDEKLVITVTFNELGLSVQTSAAMNILQLTLFIFPGVGKGKFKGLYGNNDGLKENDLVSRTGILIPANSSMSDIHQFGLTWRIAENESLFTYPIGKNYTSYQNPTFQPVLEISDNIDPAIAETCGDNTECLYDYVVTGDENLGRLSANASQQFQVISNRTVSVVICGFPPDVNNGLWITDGYTEGSVATLYCNEGNSSTNTSILCQSDRQWSFFTFSCLYENSTNSTSIAAPSSEASAMTFLLTIFIWILEICV